ncbi:DUF6354 family protein [Streptomyces chrestomyceticus]|uniref:DUF6354 family protein n=1 Tax=Streptomyces chrestomyceticus TaxID=68185 RepID=UPI003406CB2B
MSGAGARTVAPGQLYRDLAPDMDGRDRRLRVTALEDDGRVLCTVEHDLGGTAGRTTRIQLKALASPRRYALLADHDALAADPRYTRLLTAMAAVHGPAATPRDYARAAFEALGLVAGQDAR